MRTRHWDSIIPSALDLRMLMACPLAPVRVRFWPILLQKSALNEGQLPARFFRAIGAWPPVQISGATSLGRYA
jgi:hypothetical protein